MAKKRLADGNNIWKDIKDTKQVSAEVLAKNGVFALDNLEFIAWLKARQVKEKEIKLEKMRKKKYNSNECK